MLIQPSKPVHTRDWRHDFGEPLLAIRLYAQVLQSEPDIDPKMRQTLLEAIDEQASALQKRLEETLGEALSDSHC
jgi:signal transduction histidine kinase